MTQFLIERDTGDLINLDQVAKIAVANQSRGPSHVACLKDGRSVAIIDHPAFFTGQVVPANPGYRLVVPVFDGADLSKFCELDESDDVIAWLITSNGAYPETVCGEGGNLHQWERTSGWAIKCPDGKYSIPGTASGWSRDDVIRHFEERGA